MLEQLLERHFHYPDFRAGQREIIESVLSGRDTLAILPTGGGKSVCFQLPSYVYPDGLTLVVSPLLSLIEDQVMQIKARGERSVAKLTSQESADQKREVLDRINQLRYLYLSPEQLAAPLVRERLKKAEIRLFVVDEAHCVSQWGHEFRPEYTKLHEARIALGNPPCLALTATAPEAVAEDIIEHLRLKDAAIHRHSANRPEIQFLVDQSTQAEKDDRLRYWLVRLERPCVVYTATRKDAERVAALLKATHYHAGLEPEDRQLIQQQFLNDEIDTMVCTSAFGMGVNKSNVRSVLHYTLPATIEAYMQEVGRAGRDGRPSTAVLLFTENDASIHQFLLDAQYMADHAVRRVSRMIEEEGVGQVEKALQLDLKDPAYRLFASQVAQGLKAETIIEWNRVRRSVREKELGQMIAYAKSSSCRRAVLLRHFGEESVAQERCCDRCGTFVVPDARSTTQVTPLDWRTRLEEVFFSNSISV
ncbi:RecQ family ATP-dependent DNA helicase [Exiguobacterium flavidum]|uniref:RecQ family ATP-dependent DNA helicase n=1 Tax=Exiguobacterium flavidum TaxID=2184695 RepID=UPI000DF80219|nr:ATP-dependent DNA helicase RecQ [Exiguobacterium flavidum]